MTNILQPSSVIGQHIQGWQADFDPARQSRYQALQQKLEAKK